MYLCYLINTYLQVNLGVLKKNEQYNADMADILEYAHTFVPKDEEGNPAQQLFFEGDYLTFERAKVAVSSKSNSNTASQRLDGLIVKAAEFHNQAELLKVCGISDSLHNNCFVFVLHMC